MCRFRVPGSKINIRVVVSRVSGGALTRLLHMGDARDAPCCFLPAFYKCICLFWPAHISLSHVLPILLDVRAQDMRSWFCDKLVSPA